MDSSKSSRWAWAALLIGGPVLITAFQNCGQMFEDPLVKFDNVGFQSVGSLQLGTGCESQIIGKYAGLYSTTYYPFLTSTCTACHRGEGPGIGAFGYPDIAVSGVNFISRFRKINENAVLASHANGYTGTPQAMAAVASFAPQWAAAIQEYNECAGVSTAGTGLIMSSKANAQMITNAIANNQNYVTLTWNLMTEIRNTAVLNRIPITFSIEARIANIGGVRRGYELRNPSVRLNAGATGEFRVTALSVYVNDALLPDVTTYVLADGTTNSVTPVNLAPGAAVALAVTSSEPLVTDTIAIEIGAVQDAMGVVINPGGSTPPATPPPAALPATVTLAELLGTNPALNVFAASCVSCHRAGNALGGLDITNPVQARNLRTDIYARMNDAAAPMPRSGLLAFQRRELVRIWMQGGGN